MGVTLRRSAGPHIISAECPIAATVGDMVYIAGDKTVNNLYLVDLCNIDIVNRRAVGMIAAKYAVDHCAVQLSGAIDNVYSLLTPGKHLFLSAGTGARLSHNIPDRPLSGKRYIEQAGIALSSSTIFLNIQQPLVMSS